MECYLMDPTNRPPIWGGLLTNIFQLNASVIRKTYFKFTYRFQKTKDFVNLTEPYWIGQCARSGDSLFILRHHGHHDPDDLFQNSYIYLFNAEL